MDTGIVVGIIMLVLFILFPKGSLKVIGLFLLGFMVGLKGLNPTKWFD